MTTDQEDTMVNAKFEAHITFEKGFAPILIQEPIADWKFSQIDGDPLMGPNPYCYLTGFDTDSGNLLTRMQRTVQILFEQYNIPALRTKIERIIWDTKTGVDELTTVTPIAPRLAKISAVKAVVRASTPPTTKAKPKKAKK
jgi:hypothetical protein